MKILTVIETLGRGGAEQLIVNILPQINKLGIDTEVLILFDKDDLAPELEKYDIKVHKLNLSYKWNIFEATVKLIKFFRNKKYDIIHAHLFFSVFYMGISSLLLNVKTVVSFHNLAYNMYPANTMWRKIRKKIESLIVNKCFDIKIAVSNTVKKHFQKHLGIQKIDVIFNAVSVEKIQKITKTKNYLPHKNNFKQIFVTPGRFVKEKGHKELLEAIEIINKKNAEFGFYFIGDGPTKPELVKNIKSKKLNNVIILDALKHEELICAIKEADIVIIPSISEGFSLLVAECLILKKPIIATKTGAIPDMIINNKNGILVEVGNVVELYTQINLLSNNKELQNKFIRNSDKNIQLFDIQTIVNKWKKLYEEIID